MDSDDEEMRDASSSSGGGGGGEDDDGGFEEPGAAPGEGVVVVEVRWFEVDLVYEFDAPRWFDLAQEEAPVEAAAAQLWFASAPSYPPSPLIAKLLAEDLGLHSLISIADVNAEQSTKTSQECCSTAEQTIHLSHVPNEGRIPYCGPPQNERTPGTQTIVKRNFSKGSTLMKPTACQLARQNRKLEVKNVTQSKESVGVRSERSTMSSNDCTYQAAKRQRLERGHVNKVITTDQVELIHKTHDKDVMNSNSDRVTGQPKLKITIPREPELATKLRAERSRILRAVPTNSKQLNKRDMQSASTMKVVSTRKATDHEHANVLHDNARSNMSLYTSNHTRYPHSVDKKQEDNSDGLFKFKARPLDKKIISSKGDLGVFRSAKKNTTVPKEFNLSTSRKGKQAPLSELFNKLSLTNEARHGIHRLTHASELPNYITTKDCKENMMSNFEH